MSIPGRFLVIYQIFNHCSKYFNFSYAPETNEILGLNLDTWTGELLLDVDRWITAGHLDRSITAVSVQFDSNSGSYEFVFFKR